MRTGQNAYPGSMPEFRYFQKVTGEKLLQIRYVDHQIGYAGKWQDIPVEVEKLHDSTSINEPAAR